jgi:3',5'-cyclic AMP phosphodiesterase CpdA
MSPRCTRLLALVPALALRARAVPVSSAGTAGTRAATPPTTAAPAVAGAVPGGAAAATAERRRADRGPFSLAVVPDTQQEVLNPSDPRFSQRTAWLARNRRQADLRYVVQTGDLVNWGWLAPSQYAVASTAMTRLERAGVPYSIAPGNHDTRAVGWDGNGGYGGGAYVDNPECLQRFSPSQCQTPTLLRRTDEFNAVFDASRFGRVRGAFERGKVDNVYSAFRAGGLRWMVLTLELYPRAEVVDWAARVVRRHPRHNVVVATHAYLGGDGSILQGAEYGSTSPQYLYDRVVSRFRNVKMVFSGHVGEAATRIDRGVHGNKIASFLTTFHSTTTNPVRMVTVRPRRGAVSTRVEAPATGETFSRYSRVVRGLSFVR